MSIIEVKLADLSKIEECGKKCLPIYFKKRDLYFITNNKDFILYKIFEKDEIYGFILIEQFINRNHIMSFGIDPLYRRNGYGSLLINKIKNISENKSVTLNVQKCNEVAINFYIKNGFKISQKLLNYYDNLECKDAYRMEYSNNRDITKNTEMIT